MPSSAAKSYLRRLQEQTYADVGEKPRSINQKLLEQTLAAHMDASLPEGVSAQQKERYREETLREIREDVASVPSPYEDPVLYGVLRRKMEAVETALARSRWDSVDRPVIGTLPTGRVNAVTLLVPLGRGHLVVFEYQLFLFALLFSKAVLRAIPTTGSPGWFSLEPTNIHQRIQTDESVLHRFSDAVAAYAITGKPSEAAQYHVEAAYAQQLSILIDTMELFVLGHELGHVVAGHLTSASPKAAVIQSQEAQEVDYSWDQEYEADEIGLTLLLESGEADVPLAYSGADLFFSVMDVMDRVTSLLATGTESTMALGTHPPDYLRRQRLRETLASQASSADANQALALAGGLETAVELLWTDARPAFLQMSQAGLRPAASWQMAPQASVPLATSNSIPPTH